MCCYTAICCYLGLVKKVTKTTSTSNLYTETHLETSAQTGPELWEMDSIIDMSSEYAVFTVPVQRMISAAVSGDINAETVSAKLAEEQIRKLLQMSTRLQNVLVDSDLVRLVPSSLQSD